MIVDFKDRKQDVNEQMGYMAHNASDVYKINIFRSIMRNIILFCGMDVKLRDPGLWIKVKHWKKSENSLQFMVNGVDVETS